MWLPRWVVVLIVLYAGLSLITNYHNFKEGLSTIGQDIQHARGR
jgi:hypothetical protein